MIIRNFTKAGTFKLKRSEKPNQGDHIVTDMTGNSNFPSVETTVMLDELQSASDDLRTANETALSGDHEAVAIADEKELIWNLKYMVVARYVQDKADADIPNSRSIILSSGFGVRKTPERNPIPDIVAVIAATFSVNPGEVKLAWKHSKYARFYGIYISTDNVSWTLLKAIQQRKFTATGLESLTRYYFRVQAIGTAGTADPSVSVNMVTN